MVGLEKFFYRLNTNTINIMDNAIRGLFIKIELEDIYDLLDESATTNFEFLIKRIPPKRTARVCEIDTVYAL